MNNLNANADEYLLCARVINLALLSYHKSVGHVMPNCFLVFVSARSQRI